VYCRYRSINTESNAFKSKVAPFMGTMALLKALGFQKDETEGKLVLQG
jgi:PUB domain